MVLQRTRACNCASLKIDWGGFRIHRWSPRSFQWQMKNLTQGVSNTRAGRRKWTTNCLLIFYLDITLFWKLNHSTINIFNQKKTCCRRWLILYALTNLCHNLAESNLFQVCRFSTHVWSCNNDKIVALCQVGVVSHRFFHSYLFKNRMPPLLDC